MDSWASVNRASVILIVKGERSHGWNLHFFLIRNPNLIIPFELTIAILFFTIISMNIDRGVLKKSLTLPKI